MSITYREKQLTPIEQTAMQAEIDRTKQGVFTSQTELNAAIRSPWYHVDGPLGAMYRHALDLKAGRTQASGVSIIGDNKVSDIYPSTAKQAGAVRNPDGTIDVGLIDVDAPNGRPVGQPKEDQMAPQDTSHGKYGEGVRVRNLSGGVTEVSIRSGSGLPLIKQSPAEKKAREAYVEKAKAHQQWGIPGLPLIPEKK